MRVIFDQPTDHIRCNNFMIMAAYIGVCVDGNFTHGMAHTLQMHGKRIREQVRARIGIKYGTYSGPEFSQRSEYILRHNFQACKVMFFL